MITKDIMKQLFALLKRIPKGKVTTYGVLAKKLNTSPRHVGYMLKRNPRLIVIPCHRVVKSNGKIGGYTCNGRMNVKKKIKLLEKEGITVGKGKIVDFKQKSFKF